MQAASQGIGGGFAIADAGNGGCVWAICPELEQTDELRSKWQELLEDVLHGYVLNVGIDGLGVGCRSDRIAVWTEGCSAQKKTEC